MHEKQGRSKQIVLMLASVASMIDQFNMSNIKLMQQLGYKVHVACNFKKGNTCDEKRIGELKEILDKMSVTWHQWDCPRNICPIWECVTAYSQLMALTEKYSYAWIHCHSPIGGALARITAHKKKIKIIYTAHGFHFYKGAPIKNWVLYYPIEKWLSQWTNVLLTVNKEDYIFAKANLRAGRICYIPGVGVDTNKFSNIADSRRLYTKKKFNKKYSIPEDAVIFLSVGELSRRKNHQLVISVMSQLSRQDVYYIICGRGKMKKRLLHQAEKYGLEKRIRMIGFQKDLAEFYQNADIFVFPSKQEGMPVALMEAMAAGLPCVVSDIRGNRELISGEDGECRSVTDSMRFPLKQPKKLRLALERLINNKQLKERYGMYNRKKVSGYDQNIVHQRMKKIYLNMYERGCQQDEDRWP